MSRARAPGSRLRGNHRRYAGGPQPRRVGVVTSGAVERSTSEKQRLAPPRVVRKRVAAVRGWASATQLRPGTPVPFPSVGKKLRLGIDGTEPSVEDDHTPRRVIGHGMLAPF